MDKMLEYINQLYPNCGYVQIRKYDPTAWEGIEYDSKLENKAPLTQWKTSPLTFEQASVHVEKEGTEALDGLPQGYVIVDVDNEDHPESSSNIERILHEQKIKYSYNRTFRGVHFLFKDKFLSVPSVDAVMKCSLGITVDHRANQRLYHCPLIGDPHHLG